MAIATDTAALPRTSIEVHKTRTCVHFASKNWSLGAFSRETEASTVESINKETARLLSEASDLFCNKESGVYIKKFNFTTLKYTTSDGTTHDLVIDPKDSKQVNFFAEVNKVRNVALLAFPTLFTKNQAVKYTKYDSGNLQNEHEKPVPSNWLLKHKKDVMTKQKNFMSRLENSGVVTNTDQLSRINVQITKSKKLRHEYIKTLEKSCEELKTKRTELMQKGQFEEFSKISTAISKIDSTISDLNELKRNEFPIWWDIVAKELKKAPTPQWTPKTNFEALQRFFKITPPEGTMSSIGYTTKKIYKEGLRGETDPSPKETNKYLANLVSIDITDHNKKRTFCLQNNIMPCTSSLHENSILRALGEETETSPLSPVYQLNLLQKAITSNSHEDIDQCYANLDGNISETGLVNSVVQLHKNSPEEANSLVSSLLSIMRGDLTDIEIPKDDETPPDDELGYAGQAKNWLKKKWNASSKEDQPPAPVVDAAPVQQAPTAPAQQEPTAPVQQESVVDAADHSSLTQQETDVLSEHQDISEKAPVDPSKKWIQIAGFGYIKGKWGKGTYNLTTEEFFEMLKTPEASLLNKSAVAQYQTLVPPQA